MYLLKMSGLQIWLCLFTFWPITSKELNSLTTIDTLSWLGGAVVTHPLWVQEDPGSIPGSCKGFMFDFLFCCYCVFLFLSKNTFFVTKVCNSFYNVNLFSILYVEQSAPYEHMFTVTSWGGLKNMNSRVFSGFYCWRCTFH